MSDKSREFLAWFGDRLGSASECELIATLLSDRSEVGTYAKVEGLLAEAEARRTSPVPRSSAAAPAPPQEPEVFHFGDALADIRLTLWLALADAREARDAHYIDLFSDLHERVSEVFNARPLEAAVPSSRDGLRELIEKWRERAKHDVGARMAIGC